MTDTIHWLACVANTIEDLDGDAFSRECLEKMATSVGGSIPVEIEFNHKAGHALLFEMNDSNDYHELLCGMNTYVELPMEGKGLYPVLGFVHEGIADGEYVNPRILSVGLTSRPASIGTWMKRIEDA